MPISCFFRCCVLACVIGGISFADLEAQSDCTYEQCALRVRYRMFSGGDVVQGRSDDKVAGYSFFGFAPRLPMLAQSVDSVQVHYGAFRTGTNSGAILELIGVAAMVGGVIVATADGSEQWAIGLTVGGLMPLFWGAARHVQARDHLSRAVWWYNGTLR